MQRQNTCIYCGDPIERAKGESQRNYLLKRFCGRECAAALTGKTERPGSFDESANAIACDALHRRMWAMYDRVAAERGLGHSLIAAVQLGMRA